MYNIFISNFSGSYNIFTINKTKLLKVVEAYLQGDDEFTISGEKYSFGRLTTFKIYTYELQHKSENIIPHYLRNVNYSKRGLKGPYLLPETLLEMGREVTDEFIGDSPFGEKKEKLRIPNSKLFVNAARIAELKKTSSTDFDVTRLVRLCEELNDNFKHGNWLAVGMVGRTIIHHVPPIFGFRTFEEVFNNYGGPKEHISFKKNMRNLYGSLKHIADGFLHQTIRQKESLPNETQVDFRQDLDVLLGEIVRILKQ